VTVYFNGGTQPLVPEGRWGEGVVMPGERYETDGELGPPWTIDPEAEAALNALAVPTNPAGVSPPATPPEGVSPDSTTEAVSGAQDGPGEAPNVTTEPQWGGPDA